MSRSEANTDRSLGALSNLPNELLEDILSRVPRHDLKNVRYVSSFFRDLAAPFVFTTVYCAARRGVFEVFKIISHHPEISQHIVELVFDASWLDAEVAAYYEELGGQVKSTDPPTTPEGRAKYIEVFREQETILEKELEPALKHAFQSFPRLRSLIYADYSRLTGTRWDRVEDLGPEFRLGGDQWQVPQDNMIVPSPLVYIQAEPGARRRWLGLALMLMNLSRDDCQIQFDDLRLGDGRYSRGAGGVPLALMHELMSQNGKLSSRFASLRKLDITIDPEYLSYQSSDQILFPALRRLELLRLIGPPCSPRGGDYTPPLRSPAIRLPDFWGEADWPHLCALELRRISSSMADLIALLKNHLALQYINLEQIYIDEKDSWQTLLFALRSLYPGLMVEDDEESHHRGRHPSYYPVIVNFTFYNDEATLVNLSVPDNATINGYGGGQISDYRETWDYVSHNNDMLSGEEQSSSEELEYSEDGDNSEIEEIQDMLASGWMNSENRKAGIPYGKLQQSEDCR
ncbi:MAG: hypothetical protein Q9220_006031 [cf. Caloplaca sp. 1 TL-2023]